MGDEARRTSDDLLVLCVASVLQHEIKSIVVAGAKQVQPHSQARSFAGHRAEITFARESVEEGEGEGQKKREGG